MLTAAATINTVPDMDVLDNFYSDIAIVRVPMESTMFKNWNEYKVRSKVWADPLTEVYHNWPPQDSKLKSSFEKYDPDNRLSEIKPRSKLDPEALKLYAHAVLNRCNKIKPDLISIPQMPHIRGKSRHRINLLLAKEAFNWKNEICIIYNYYFRQKIFYFIYYLLDRS